MNDLKKWLAFFPGKKKSHKKKRPTPKESLEEEACKVIRIGTTEDPLFTPQPLMNFIGIYKAIKTAKPVSLNISEIELLQLRNPLTKENVVVVFAIKEKEGYIWSKIASTPVYFSSDQAFIYETTDVFDVPLCENKEKQSILAHCHYEKGDITVLSLFLENEKIKDFETPCSLDDALRTARAL